MTERLSGSAGGPTFVTTYRFEAPDKADPANSTLVLPGVTELDLRFFDGQDWIQEWDSNDSRNFAPAPLETLAFDTVSFWLILGTTSSPSITFPKTVWTPFRCFAFCSLSTIKN